MTIELTERDKSTIRDMCLFETPEKAKQNLLQYFKDKKEIDVAVEVDESEHTILVYHNTEIVLEIGGEVNYET